MSYYPEGVTGGELAIAGPDGYMTKDLWIDLCDEFLPGSKDVCDWSGLVEFEAATYRSRAWGEYECPGCGAKTEWEGEV